MLTLTFFFRFFRQFLLLFVIHMTSVSMFRFIASIFQTVVASVTAGTVAIVFVLLFGGFIIPKRKNPELVYFFNTQFCSENKFSCFSIVAYMPSWLRWGFWVSPVSYGEIGLTVNEFLAPRWEKVIVYNSFCASFKELFFFSLMGWISQLTSFGHKNSKGSN